MKVRVLKECVNALTGAAMFPGEIIEISPERFKAAPAGYVEEVTEPKKKASRKKEG